MPNQRDGSNEGRSAGPRFSPGTGKRTVTIPLAGGGTATIEGDTIGVGLRKLAENEGLLEGLDLTGCSMGVVVLRQTWLKGCKLAEVEGVLALSGCKLTGCSFDGANLAASRFEHCDAQNCSFVETCLETAVIWQSTFDQIDFSGADLRRSRIERSRLRDCGCRAADLGNARFANVLMDGCGFEQSNLGGAAIGYDAWHGCELRGNDFRGARCESASAWLADITSGDNGQQDFPRFASLNDASGRVCHDIGPIGPQAFGFVSGRQVEPIDWIC